MDESVPARLIVIAERHDALRVMIRRVLMRERYRVALPEPDDDRLVLCADARVDLAIVDTSWAGNGAATLALVTTFRPDLPVLFIGELAGPARGQHSRRELSLQKPFAVTALVGAVRLLLSEGTSGDLAPAFGASSAVPSVAPAPALTEDDVIATMQAYYEGLFPKTCPHCLRVYATLAEYVAATEPLGRYLSYDLDSGATAPEIGTLAFASCPCGDTLALATDGLPGETRLRLLEWVRSAAAQRGISASDLMDHFRIELRRRIARGDSGAVH